MPKKTFAFDKGGPQRLVLSWSFGWKKFVVELDGAPLGTIDNVRVLKAGQDFPLGDGTTLRVQLTTGLGAELQVLRDGQPLPGSGGDPETRIKTASSVVFFVAGLNAVLGLAAVAFEVEFLLANGIGYPSLVIAAVFGGLGLAVKLRRSQIALILAVGLFALDGIGTVVLGIMDGVQPGVGGIIVRVLLLIPMIKGIGAIRELKNKSGA